MSNRDTPTDLGYLEELPLREAWKSESQNFTPWLADNLELLDAALNMSLDLVGTEVAVGPYAADIVCENSTDGSQVVIENQLTKTNHDHLGKALTYAAHLGACTVVWVASEFTDQHREALDWLNRISKGNAFFFGVEIHLWKIGDSPKAPGLNVVVQPQDWTGTPINTTDLGNTQKMQLQFWREFSDYVAQNGSSIRKISNPAPRSWLKLAGVGLPGFFFYGVISTLAEDGGHEIRAELGIGPIKDSDHFYDLLHEERTAIEQEIQNDYALEEELQWSNLPNIKRRTVFFRSSTNLDDHSRRTEQYHWLLKRAEALYQILESRIRKLPAP